MWACKQQIRSGKWERKRIHTQSQQETSEISWTVCMVGLVTFKFREYRKREKQVEAVWHLHNILWMVERTEGREVFESVLELRHAQSSNWSWKPGDNLPKSYVLRLAPRTQQKINRVNGSLKGFLCLEIFIAGCEILMEWFCWALLLTLLFTLSSKYACNYVYPIWSLIRIKALLKKLFLRNEKEILLYKQHKYSILPSLARDNSAQ